MATLQCEIVTPERRLFSSEASFVVLPGAEGEMGVLPKHEPVVTTLKAGSVRVTEEGAKEPVRYLVAGGYAQVDADRVIILADRAIGVAEVNKERVSADLDEVKARIATLDDGDPSKAFALAELEWDELLLAHA